VGNAAKKKSQKSKHHWVTRPNKKKKLQNRPSAQAEKENQNYT
jgi:hypothetical protein